jgi:lipopolysaccharide transport system permease protein
MFNSERPEFSDSRFDGWGKRNSMSTDLEVFVKKSTERSGTPSLAPVSTQPVTIIRPSTGWKVLSAVELWHYRGLILNFVWRDVKVRYKHTILGIGWAVLQPFMMMLVFASFFGMMGSSASATVPYAVYAYSGIMPWLFFSSATVAAGSSIVYSEHLITKIYFPRLVVTVASLGVFIVDFIIAFLLFIALMLYFEQPPIWSWLLAPAVLALFAVAALGVGINLAALNVTYRDVRLVVPFMMQLWFFATPVIFMPYDPGSQTQREPIAIESKEGAPYSRETITQAFLQAEKTRARHEMNLLYNPIYSLIITFRAAMLGQPAVPWLALGRSMAIFVGLLLLGSVYFHRVEDRFADII